MSVIRIVFGDVAYENRHVLMDILLGILQDALFAALAAIGFAAVSNPPRRAFPYCAVIAAIAHSCRYTLINLFDWHIVAATAFASTIVGILAVVISPKTRIPSETYLYPSLLPMIPGVYAYRTFGAMLMCLYNDSEQSFDHYFYLLCDNGFICFFILLGMTIGATIPMFLLPNIAFSATRFGKKRER